MYISTYSAKSMIISTIVLTRVTLVIGLVDSTFASLAGHRLLASCLVGLGSCILVSVDQVGYCGRRSGSDVADGLHFTFLGCDVFVWNLFAVLM